MANNFSNESILRRRWPKYLKLLEKLKFLEQLNTDSIMCSQQLGREF